jgi:glutamate carboxypeptidase
VGGTGGGTHAPGETVDLSAQPINTKRDALLMYRLSRLDAHADLQAATSSHEE